MGEESAFATPNFSAEERWVRITLSQGVTRSLGSPWCRVAVSTGVGDSSGTLGWSLGWGPEDDSPVVRKVLDGPTIFFLRVWVSPSPRVTGRDGGVDGGHLQEWGS